MIDWIKDNWPAMTVAAAWLARERLNFLAAGRWVVVNGGLIGLLKKLFWGEPQKNSSAPAPAPAGPAQLLAQTDSKHE